MISSRRLKDILVVVIEIMITTKQQQQQPKKEEEIVKKMSGIKSNIMPLVSTVGFVEIAGFLVGFALKRIMKILALIAGVFLLLFYIWSLSKQLL